ncbi:UNVERIFIED_CONTAM: hypothetical protein Sangu_3203800 [Sesamum angustifolium]|uniref:Uncharacterized protein n=1 Tax=Sesamum angustifolium TaxID=2727405 RepID=A0AAW2JKV1_9LAMI
MVFDAVGLSYFASSHEGVPDDGTRSCPVDVGTSSYVYGGGGLYNYDDQGWQTVFQYIVDVANQPLWDGCINLNWGVVAELVDIKTDGHISERTYDKNPNGLIEYCPLITLCQRSLQHEKLVKNWIYPLRRFMCVRMVACCTGKDDVDLEYCRFCEEARYKPTRGRDPHQNKYSYAILRYLPLTPRMQRLYYSGRLSSTCRDMPHTIRQRRSMCHPFDARGVEHLIGCILILQKEV